MTNFKALFFLLLFTISYSSSFGQAEKLDFNIRGTISGGSNIELFISEIDEGFNPILKNESKILTKNGKFTYHIKGENSKLLYIHSPDFKFHEFMAVLVNQPQTIINIDTKNWDRFFVSGSTLTNAYFNFVKEYGQANTLVKKNSKELKLPRFKRDTVDGKPRLLIIETYNCYLLKSDTFPNSDSTDHSLMPKKNIYGNVTSQIKEEIPNGYVIKYYGDTSEAYRDRIVLKHLILNKNTEVGAIIAYQHFGLRRYSPLTFSEEVIPFYQMLTSYSQSSLYGRSLKQYIDLNTKNQRIDFEFTDISGNRISLSSVKSKFILVHFWASWCGNCRPENKLLATMYKKYTREQLEFINISFDEDRKKWQNAIQKDGLPGYHTSELKIFNSDLGRLFSVTSLPSSFLLDNEHKIILINPTEVQYIQNRIDTK